MVNGVRAGSAAALEGSASQSYALAVIEYFEDRGHDPDAVFGADWVARVRHNEGLHRLPLHEWESLLRTAARVLGDVAFPVRLAATIRMRHLGLLGFLLMSCATLGEAALVLQRYEQLLDSVNAADIHLESEHATLTWRPLVEHPPAEAIMLSMCLWAHHGRWLSERPDLVADARFAFAEPASAELRDALQQAFGGQVRYGQPINQMRLPLAYLSLPVAQRNRQIHEALRQQADHELTRLLGQERGFLTHLEWVIADGLAQGRVTLQQTAEAVQMAPRTLQSRLEQHGLTFREVLDRVRYRLAELHLGNPALSLSDVAARLGFAEQSAFQHAFKRWSGQSPGDYRRRLG